MYYENGTINKNNIDEIIEIYKNVFTKIQRNGNPNELIHLASKIVEFLSYLYYSYEEESFFAFFEHLNSKDLDEEYNNQIRFYFSMFYILNIMEIVSDEYDNKEYCDYFKYLNFRDNKPENTYLFLSQTFYLLRMNQNNDLKINKIYRKISEMLAYNCLKTKLSIVSQDYQFNIQKLSRLTDESFTDLFTPLVLPKYSLEMIMKAYYSIFEDTVQKCENINIEGSSVAEFYNNYSVSLNNDSTPPVINDRTTITLLLPQKGQDIGNFLNNYIDYINTNL